MPARPAATVLLLRDGADGIEVFMLRRRATMAFAAGMYAYPGGAVEPGDASPAHAAVRETYEEAGVLLAGPAGGDGVVTEVPGPGGPPAFDAFLEHHGLTARTGLLAPWARWVTPEWEARRYDTWFFVAALPPGQRCRNASTEADRTAWLRPADALAYGMLPPTVATLRALLPYAEAGGRAEDVRAAAAAAPVPGPVMARAAVEGGDVVVSWPGYEDFGGRLPAAPREPRP